VFEKDYALLKPTNIRKKPRKFKRFNLNLDKIQNKNFGLWFLFCAFYIFQKPLLYFSNFSRKFQVQIQ